MKPPLPATVDATTYKFLRLFHEQDLAKYNYEVEKFRKAGELIFKTISARINYQITYSEPDPWSKLVALKRLLFPPRGAMTTTLCSSFAATGTRQKSFLIHDGKSNVNVRNNYSKHLFTKFRDARHDEFLSDGTSGTKIEC